MDRIFYTFKGEPSEQIYRDLIDYVVQNDKCKYSFLIVRNDKLISASEQNALQLLAPFLLEVQDVFQWPGTKLLGRTAKLYKYNFCLEFADMLKKLSQGLYEWKHPDLPEDLCLMITEKLPWLFSIAHEKDAVLCLTPEEVDDLMANNALASMLIKDNNYHEN